MNNDLLYKAKVQAWEEIEEEKFAKAVEQEKQRLMTKKPWWVKLFPFVITVIIKRR